MKITISQISTVLAALLLMSVSAAAWAQETRLQTESEFQELMPISGEVETFFGKFELDHSFPTKKTADDIYDLMDHQRASQLYLVLVHRDLRCRHPLLSHLIFIDIGLKFS